MTQHQHKIIILDDNQKRRDALKSMVAQWGHTPFIFEKEYSKLATQTGLNNLMLFQIVV